MIIYFFIFTFPFRYSDLVLAPSSNCNTLACTDRLPLRTTFIHPRPYFPVLFNHNLHHVGRCYDQG